MIEEIAALVQITKSVYKAGVWVRNTRVNWNVPSLTGVANIEGKLEAEYYSFAKDDGGVKKFLLKRKNFTEEKRLINDRARLLDFYPGLRGRLLTDERVGVMPYEVLDYKIDNVSFTKKKELFQICGALKDVRDIAEKGLEKYYESIGTNYTSQSLVRACDWETDRLSIQEVMYTDAAATNLIVDLDLQSALGKTTLAENSAEKCNTLRKYDLTLSGQPGCYPSLKESSLANPIGVAGIAITADNKLILSHRPRKVSTYTYKLGPSSSGYVAWDDLALARKNTLNSLLSGSLMREIKEELNIGSAHISKLHPLGFFREFYRGGMPQAFYCFRLNLTAEALASRIKGAKDFRESVGVLAVKVNRQALPKVIATLVQAQAAGSYDLGLEAQGLLTALARNGEDFLFS